MVTNLCLSQSTHSVKRLDCPPESLSSTGLAFYFTEWTTIIFDILQLNGRACFKKNSSLHIWAKNSRTTFFRILHKKILFYLSKILMTFFLVIYLFLPFSTLLNFCLYVFLNTMHPSALLYTPTCCFPRFYNSLSTHVTVNASECCIHHLFILKSSLHKQPFITAHFRSSLHILCITAH